MKKILLVFTSIILCMSMLFSLASCLVNNDETSENGESSSPDGNEGTNPEGGEGNKSDDIDNDAWTKI